MNFITRTASGTLGVGTIGASVMALLLTAPAGVASAGASTRAPAPYTNCTKFNKKYPHGVGRVGARDKTKSGDPVTNFKRSNKIYRLAMSKNDDLDRDKDGVACEKD
jgi:hypothetical protein